MPRTRFAKAVSPSFETPERASIRQALWFDVEAADTSDDETLSESRVANFDHTAVLLGATHLLLGVTCLVRHPELLAMSFISPIVPLVLIVLLDGVAAMGLHWRRNIDVAPHTISRAMCGYIAGVGVLWTLFGLAVFMQ